jgi:hypothetical protein
MLGTIHIKNLKALTHWVNERHKLNQNLDSLEFNAATIQEVGNRLNTLAQEEKMDVALKELPEFKADNFETFQLAFLNKLANIKGTQNEPLLYIVRDQNPPNAFTTVEEERRYQLPLVGDKYDSDNRTVFQILKSHLTDTPGWSWIEPYDAIQDGRAAYFAWSLHYDGDAEQSKRHEAARAQLQKLHYKNEKSLPWDTVTTLATKCFNALAKDEDEALSDRQKVRKIYEMIKVTDQNLIAARQNMIDNYLDDYDGAINYFATAVNRVFGQEQLELQTQARKRRRISATGRGGGGRQ